MSEVETNVTLEATATAAKRVRSAGFFKRLIKEKPLGTVGGVITLLLLLTGIFANLIAPYGMNETHMDESLASPSAKYLLGTDDLGRDVLSRVIYGARVSMIVGLSGATLSTLISLVLGMLSGYIGGTLDLIMQRFVDAWMCLPGLIVLMIIISFLGGGMLSIIVVLGLQWGITGSRIIRGAVISIRGNVYVTAAEAIGSPMSKILVRHILPNIMAPAIILLTIRIPAIILTEASLSFLGFGIQPPFPSWGAMLAGRSRQFMFVAPWTVIWPGIALAIVVYGANMFGDAVRDILDPKLRGSAGRYGLNPKKKRRLENQLSGKKDLSQKMEKRR